MMINVLFISDGLREGGKERQLFEIIRLIDKKRFRIGVITFNQNQHYSSEIKNLAEYFAFVPKRPTRLEPFILLWKKVKDFNPQIIYVWDSLSALYSILPAKVLKIKFINGSIRDAGIEKGIDYFVKRLLLIKSDLIISNSAAGLQYYGVKGQVIYNLIDINRFRFPAEVKKQFNVAMVASFSDYKDYKTFIDASAILLERGVIDRVFLVGEGKHKEKYMRYVENSIADFKQYFHFTGLIRNVEEILMSCSVGVLCSTSIHGEGVSNSVLEYMAAGLVPIATDVGGSREIITHGLNGFLISEGGKDEIVNIITELKMEKGKMISISKEARNTINQKFSHLENIKKIEKLFSAVYNG